MMFVAYWLNNMAHLFNGIDFLHTLSQRMWKLFKNWPKIISDTTC